MIINNEQMKHRFYVDNYGYMLEKSRSWDSGDGKGDAVARTVLAAIIYREQKFIDIIRFIFQRFIFQDIWEPERHIEDPRTEDFSRDHTIWFVIWLCYFCPVAIKQSMKIPWKISEKFNQSIDMWLWIRAIARKRWINKLLYWAVASIIMGFNNLRNRWLRNRADIESVYYKDFKATPESELNKEELFARKHSAPGYIMDTQAFMIHCLPDGWFKEKLKKRMVPLVERSNYLIRQLMNDEFNWTELSIIKSYSGMDGFRWSRRLDKTTDIDLNPLTGDQPPYNMDVDVLNANFEIP